MSDELEGLLGRVEDPALRADLRAHFDRVRAKRSFGLVFESHLPERVQLPNHPIRVGSKVVVRDDADSPTFQVIGVSGGTATLRAIRHADGSRLGADEAEDADDVSCAFGDLVVTADFDDPIYPGLRMLGSVQRGGDKPAQVVIKGENHHVLQALRFTHAGKIDCIYIDPPYNTGAKDWKYDNNYVDDTDAYRHSKWLAFMERRLLLAKELLNPQRSVLIVTIDEKEVHRLGLLLEQTFPGLDVQTVTAVTNQAGSLRTGRFTRVEEYVYYVFLGDAVAQKWKARMLDGVVTQPKLPTLWFTAIRQGGGGALRANRTTPVLFYPVHLDAETGLFHSVGEPYAAGKDISDYEPPKGTVALWPLHSDGTEQTWQFGGEQMKKRFADGEARLGKRDPETGQRPVTYLRTGTLKKIESGELQVIGRTEEGALELALAAGTQSVGVAPAAVWSMRSHFARDYGTGTLKALLPNRAFPFPKSLYAVEDTIRVAVADNPDAVVLDFFAGSGTTAHAVARLNRQDGGRRQSILVTNNEVSPAEAKTLRAAGHRPGDAEWEALGIFEHITRPRITAAVTGETPEGDPIKGDYKFTDEFPMADGFDENVVFAELTYQDADDIALDLAFEAIAPLLWLRAGGQGPVIETCLDAAGRHRAHVWAETYGILFNPDRWRSFIAHIPESARVAFVVTDSASVFAEVAAELPASLEVVRLYENYLTTFRIGGTTSGGVG